MAVNNAINNRAESMAITRTLSAGELITANGGFSVTAGNTSITGTGTFNLSTANAVVTINSGTAGLNIGTDNTANLIQIGTGSAAKACLMGSVLSTSQTALFYGTNGFQVSSAFAVTIDATSPGVVSFVAQPSFSSFLSATQNNATGDGTNFTIICNTEDSDQSASYNNATGVFTAPGQGNYLFTAQCRLDGITALTASQFTLVTTLRTFYTGPIAVTLNSAIFEISVVAFMQQNDTASIAIQTTDSGGKIDDVFGHVTQSWTRFTGSKLT